MVTLFCIFTYRRLLQSNKCLDLSLRLFKESSDTVLLPILPSCLSQVDLPSLRTLMASESVCEVVWRQVTKTNIRVLIKINYNTLITFFFLQSPQKSKKKSGQTPFRNLERMLQELVENGGEGWTEELRRDLPRSFQRHGDLIVLGDNCFTLPRWSTLGTANKPVKRRMVISTTCKRSRAFVLDGDLLWGSVAKAAGAKRLAKMSRISRDGFRSPIVTMLLGEHSWVTHVDNGIR